MGEVKKFNIKSAYHYFKDMVNIKDFHSNSLNIEKKSHKDIDVYYIGYIVIKKFDDYENIHNVNPLYLIISSATGYSKEKNGEKYLILDPTEKYVKVFSGIKVEIKTIHERKKLFYEKNYVQIRINTDDDLPLNKPLKFPMLTITIRSILQKGIPQISLDVCMK